MDYIRIEGEWTSVFAVCQAHAQLESDYNVDGIVRERPSNKRRNASTGVQLLRMKYSNPYGWTDITDDSNDSDDDQAVRFIYLSNVLKWDLPFDTSVAEMLTKTFTEEFLEPYQGRIAQAMAGHYMPERGGREDSDSAPGATMN